METGREGAKKEAKEEQPGRLEENQKLVKPGGMSRSERQGETTCAKSERPGKKRRLNSGSGSLKSGEIMRTAWEQPDFSA